MIETTYFFAKPATGGEVGCFTEADLAIKQEGLINAGSPPLVICGSFSATEKDTVPFLVGEDYIARDTPNTRCWRISKIVSTVLEADGIDHNGRVAAHALLEARDEDVPFPRKIVPALYGNPLGYAEASNYEIVEMAGVLFAIKRTAGEGDYEEEYDKTRDEPVVDGEGLVC